jgi:cold shock CspA family protein
MESPATVPLEITFRGMDRSVALEDSIRERAVGLARFGSLLGCRVVVESPHRRHRQGQVYHVRVRLTLPGAERVVRRDPPEHHAHEDPYVAVRDAFDAARRQVEDFVREQRGATKSHAAQDRGEVVRLVPERDHGFIRSGDGREIYFHRNSVLHGGYDRLQVGSEVRYSEEQGEEGPQASTVVGRGLHHSIG